MENKHLISDLDGALQGENQMDTRKLRVLIYDTEEEADKELESYFLINKAEKKAIQSHATMRSKLHQLSYEHMEKMLDIQYGLSKIIQQTYNRQIAIASPEFLTLTPEENEELLFQASQGKKIYTTFNVYSFEEAGKRKYGFTEADDETILNVMEGYSNLEDLANGIKLMLEEGAYYDAEKEPIIYAVNIGFEDLLTEEEGGLLNKMLETGLADFGEPSEEYANMRYKALSTEEIRELEEHLNTAT